MPGGGKPFALRSLSVPAIIVRTTIGNIIAGVILAASAHNIYKGLISGSSESLNVLAILFYGVPILGVVFCLFFLVAWNIPVVRELIRRKRVDNAN